MITNSWSLRKVKSKINSSSVLLATMSTMIEIVASTSELRKLKGSSKSDEDDDSNVGLMIGIIVGVLLAIPVCACLCYTFV